MLRTGVRFAMLDEIVGDYLALPRLWEEGRERSASSVPSTPADRHVQRYYHLAEDERWFSNSGPCYRAARRADGGLPRPRRPRRRGLRLTLALMLAAALAGRHPGDAVLLPSFTFAATAAAIVWAGLQPVFVDIDPATWSLDADALGDALRRARGHVAVLACSTFGTPPPAAELRRWEALTRAAGVPLLIDSAAGLGARDDDGTLTGGGGDAEVFSLHATKPFAIGEGGLFCTRNADLAAQVARLANFGFEGGAVTGAIGLNAKLAEWPAATALAVLDRYDEILARRRAHAADLRERLAGAELTFQPTAGQPTWQFVPAAAASPEARAAILDAAVDADVELRAYFDQPLHTMPGFAHAERHGDLPVTRDLSARILSLPMANDLTGADLDLIVDTVGSAARAGASR